MTNHIWPGDDYAVPGEPEERGEEGMAMQGLGESDRQGPERENEGVWRHGDFAEWSAHGGIIIHGRSDATLNPGGVRIGTADIYAQVEEIPEDS